MTGRQRLAVAGCAPTVGDPARPPILREDTVQLWFMQVAVAEATTVRRAAHELLGRLLAAHGGLAVPPALERGAHGKPYAPALPGLGFNLSHSGEGVLIGIARSMALGVDLERHDRRLGRVDELARRFFTSDEATALAGLPAADRRGAFLRLWTHKEAVGKATGRGIGLGLDRVGFAIDPEGRDPALVALPAGAGGPEEWQVTELTLPAPFLAAVAWRGPARELQCFRLADDSPAEPGG